jgi:O-antigen/teichoic acid export membrane protein
MHVSVIAELREMIALIRRNTDKMQVGVWGFGNSLIIPAYGLFAVFVVFRIMPKEELGVYLVVQSIYLLIVQLASSFSFVPMVRHFFDKESRSHVVGGGIVLNLLFIVPVLLILAIFHNIIGMTIGCPGFSTFVWFLCVAVLLRSAAEFRIAILQALHRTKAVFLINGLYHVVFIAVVTGMAMGPGLDRALQLLWGLVISAGISAVFSFLVSPRGLFAPSVSMIEVRRLLDYGKYTLGSGISGAIFTRMDIVLLSAFRGPLEVATYGVSKVFTRLFDVYTHTGNLVLFPFLSRLWGENRRADIRRLYKTLLTVSNMLFVPMVFVLMVASKPVVAAVYGDKYPSAGTLLAVFALIGLTVPWRNLGHNVINAAGKPGYVFGFRIAIALLNLFLDILLIRRYGALGAIIATLTSLCALALVLTSKARATLAEQERPPEGRSLGFPE